MGKSEKKFILTYFAHFWHTVGHWRERVAGQVSDRCDDYSWSYGELKFSATKRLPFFQISSKDISSTFDRMDLNLWRHDVPKNHDPTIIPGVCGIESFEHKKTPHFPNFFEGYLVELSPDGLDPLAMWLTRAALTLQEVSSQSEKENFLEFFHTFPLNL